MKYVDIFWVFLKLGCTSFGGPVAHLMYFRQAFVEQRKWLSEQEYSNIIALCQALPGPASSQVGFTVGLNKGGLLGALLAFIGFTLPSVILLLLFANYLSLFDSSLGLAALQGLAILAFAVVLHGVLGMGKSLCFDTPRFSIALLTFISMLLAESILTQVAVIVIGGLLGFILIQASPHDTEIITNNSVENKKGLKLAPSISWAALLLGLFFALPFISDTANQFYRSGALVFGGGHVVLPLLEEAVVAVGKVSQADFLAGYGATQAVPGPMFTFATYLGFLQSEDGGLQGALIATVFVFLPGFLLVLAIYPFWQKLSANTSLQNAISGANAAVVGLLAAALYDPIFTHAIGQPSDMVIAALAYAGLARFKLPVLWVVFFCIAIKLALVFVHY